MATEIGSEFWDVPTCEEKCKLFPAHSEWFVSGRSALSAIIADALYRCEVRTAGLPSWCCESMVVPFARMGIEVVFYPVMFVNESLRQNVAAVLDCDLILIMGYFGMSDAPEVPASYEGIVVEDLTHSLLSDYRCYRADYAFGSLRKWCGVWTGGFAWRRDGDRLTTESVQCDRQYVNYRCRAMEAKAVYMMTREGDKAYLETFAEAEKWLDANTLTMQAASRDVLITNHIDIRCMRAVRRQNANVLLDGLRCVSRITQIFPKQLVGDCPLFVPVLTEDRDALRRYLIENHVYCPVHWPISYFHDLDEDMRRLYKNGLSLVCDQRYGTDDMQRICDLVRTWQRTD